MIVEESSDDDVKLAPLNQNDSNSRKADLLQRSQSARLPAIVPPVGSRQQFRPSSAFNKESRSGSSDAEDPLMRLILKLQSSQDDLSTANALEQLGESLPGDLMYHRKKLMTILSRHLTSDNIRILFPLAELLLILARNEGARSPLLILASKVIFKLARDESNDNMFLSRRILDLLLNALGHHCPRRDHEAFVYAYAGLKFLSLNGKIATYLSDSLGFLHLCMLHTKLLCEDAKSSVTQVMFQITSCLRNLCNLADNCQKFMSQLEGMKALLKLVDSFPQDIDVMCNVSRILSVLTASYDELFDKTSIALNKDVIDALYVILSRHHDRRDVVVRVTFVLGNLAANSSDARVGIGMHSDTVALLPLLLRRYLSDSLREGREYINTDEAALDFGSTGNSEDTAVKIIRVFANASIEPDTVLNFNISFII